MKVILLDFFFHTIMPFDWDLPFNLELLEFCASETILELR